MARQENMIRMGVTLIMVGVGCALAWATDQGQSVRLPDPTSRLSLPFQGASAILSTPNQEQRPKRLLMQFPVDAEDREVGKNFLGIPWLTLPTAPIDDDITVEHRLHEGEKFSSTLAFLTSGSDQLSPISSVDQMVDREDASVVAAIRLKF